MRERVDRVRRAAVDEHRQHCALDGAADAITALILALTLTLTLTRALIRAVILALTVPLALTWMVRPTRAVMALTQLAMTCTEREMRCSVASTWGDMGRYRGGIGEMRYSVPST